ncbi:hypothetical protein B9Z65_3879 [Elsinoe australis]|uniref:Ubiquitin-like modifier HUB1 n=1 Tax=Elsinoe australis TaxID=40998 RepID=A0A2P8A2U5_9PEZI|nr:hypothetical protein B9Z65_3879 [Elsinoe australis]
MARSRSRSPTRPKKSKGGFKWKEKAAPDSAPEPTTSHSTYRERSPKYDSRDRDRDRDADRKRPNASERSTRRSRSRSRERRRHSDRDQAYREDRYHDRDGGRSSRKEDPPPPADEAVTSVPAAVVDKTSVAAKFGARAAKARPVGGSGEKKDGTNGASMGGGADAKGADNAASGQAQAQVQEKSKPKYKTAASSEPMIIVHVNDRLGTKAAIPCLASDPVKAFKAMVAARIGRQTHEIMLKRQGERPFKDQLTLEDYGVSNGVQLDLELDTGD